MASFGKGLEADLPLYSEPKWYMDAAQIPWLNDFSNSETFSGAFSAAAGPRRVISRSTFFFLNPYHKPGVSPDPSRIVLSNLVIMLRVGEQLICCSVS